MKSLIVILLSLLTISNIKGNFSINAFINELQNKGIYEILKEITYQIGCDVSISFCKALYETNDCETVIKVYIGCPSKARSFRGRDEEKSLGQILEPYKLTLRKAGFMDNEIDEIIKKMS